VALIDIETGVRGFVIFGDPTYLEPFYRGRDTLTHIREKFGTELEQWTEPGYSDQALGLLMEQRGKLFADVLQTAQIRDFNAAREQLRVSPGRPLMDRMRILIA
jgi:CHASE3 domain sensor protein